MTPIPGFHAVVPAGGAGTRLWPLSRRARPKFLLDLTGSGRTLLQSTWDRLVPLTGADGVMVVTGESHAAAVAEQLPGLTPAALLTEPSGRDSMAAIGLAAALLRERHGDVVLGSFAADHVVRRPAAFHTAVREAVAAARAGYVVTIGIEADHPSTAFGYIESGAPLEVDDAPSALHVASFAEKPDGPTAADYLATGRFRWNAGMFVVRAQVLLEHLSRLQPALHDGVVAIARAWDTPQRAETVTREWPRLTRIAIDHAVAEPVAADGGVAVVPAELGWDDVGDWRSLGALLPDGPGGVRSPGEGVLALASEGAVVVPADGRLVALLGVPDVVVVDTPDALLVTTTAHAQRLGELVGRLPDVVR